MLEAFTEPSDQYFSWTEFLLAHEKSVISFILGGKVINSQVLSIKRLCGDHRLPSCYNLIPLPPHHRSNPPRPTPTLHKVSKTHFVHVYFKAKRISHWLFFYDWVDVGKGSIMIGYPWRLTGRAAVSDWFYNGCLWKKISHALHRKF